MRFKTLSTVRYFLYWLILISLLVSKQIIAQDTTPYQVQKFPPLKQYSFYFGSPPTHFFYGLSFTQPSFSISLDVANSSGANQSASNATFPYNQSSTQRNPALTTKKTIRRKFFISYTKRDLKFAKTLKSELEKQGYMVWLDKDCIEAGSEWRDAIDNAIKDALAVIVVMSPDAKQSEYVSYEWAFAFGSAVKVLPIMFRKTSLHPRLETIQYIDFSNRRYKPWDLLFNTLDKMKSSKGRSKHGS